MKKLLFALCALTLAVGCGGNAEKKSEDTEKRSEDTVKKSEAKEKKVTETEAPYKVGDLYCEDGVVGVVFEATHGGYHGKIVSVDQELFGWCDESVVGVKTGAVNKYDGAINTAKLMNRYDADLYYAALWCVNYGYGWYLPAKRELMKIYDNREAINRTLSEYGLEEVDCWYWSSTEDYECCAWIVSMHNGGTDYYGKYFDYSVRAVSAF